MQICFQFIDRHVSCLTGWKERLLSGIFLQILRDPRLPLVNDEKEEETHYCNFFRINSKA